MKNLLIVSAALFAAFLLFTASKCGSAKYKYTEESSINMTKTGCFGTCPVYTFTISGNGEASYSGRQFVELEGQFNRLFPADTTNFIFDTFIKADLWQYENEYTDDVTDLPTTFLMFKHGGKTKQIRLYYGFPKELQDLTDKLQELAFSPGWPGEAPEK
jgi:hypothetical protein